MKKLTNKGLTRKLDEATRKAVQNRDLDWREYGKCFSCEKTLSRERLQVGHYISRRHHSVRWNLRNCHLQCVTCNGFRGGNLDEYALNLQRSYGDSILEELHKEKQKTLSYKDKEKILEELNVLILNPSNR